MVYGIDQKIMDEANKMDGLLDHLKTEVERDTGRSCLVSAVKVAENRKVAVFTLDRFGGDPESTYSLKADVYGFCRGKRTHLVSNTYGGRFDLRFDSSESYGIPINHGIPDIGPRWNSVDEISVNGSDVSVKVSDIEYGIKRAEKTLEFKIKETENEPK